MNTPNLKPKDKTFVILIVGMIVGAVVVAGAYEFNMRYYLRSPFQNPIQKRELSPIPDKIRVEPITAPTVAPKPTEKPKPTEAPKLKSKADIVKESKYPDFIDHIWHRESGRGTAPVGLNSYCEGKGMSNEMGFYPSGKHCFSDFETSVRRLERWYEDNSKLTDNQKLCRYNSGQATETCAYLSYNFSEMN